MRTDGWASGVCEAVETGGVGEQDMWRDVREANLRDTDGDAGVNVSGRDSSTTPNSTGTREVERANRRVMALARRQMLIGSDVPVAEGGSVATVRYRCRYGAVDRGTGVGGKVCCVSSWSSDGVV